MMIDRVMRAYCILLFLLSSVGAVFAGHWTESYSSFGNVLPLEQDARDSERELHGTTLTEVRIEAEDLLGALAKLNQKLKAQGHETLSWVVSQKVESGYPGYANPVLISMKEATVAELINELAEQSDAVWDFASVMLTFRPAPGPRQEDESGEKEKTTETPEEPDANTAVYTVGYPVVAEFHERMSARYDKRHPEQVFEGDPNELLGFGVYPFVYLKDEGVEFFEERGDRVKLDQRKNLLYVRTTEREHQRLLQILGEVEALRNAKVLRWKQQTADGES